MPVRRNTVRTGALLLAIAALVVAVGLSVAIGAKTIPLPAVWDAIWHASTAEDSVIVRQLRIPRTIVAIAVGTALGVAGALIQALSRNPLADPGILGVNAGAALAVALGASAFGIGNIGGQLAMAFTGALVVTIGVYLVGSAGRSGADPVRLVLAGVALSAVALGITTAIMLIDPRSFDQMRFWQAGSVVGRELAAIWPALPLLGIGVLLAAAVAPSLNAISLGDDMARSLGTPIARTRVVVIVAVTVLAGGATAIAGPIAFLGLMVPHVARWIVGLDQRWILALTAVIAPVFMLVADVAGRLLLRPGEVPVGVVTAFVGAPVLILLARRAKASRL